MTIGLKRCYHTPALNRDCLTNGEFDAIKGIPALAPVAGSPEKDRYDHNPLSEV